MLQWSNPICGSEGLIPRIKELCFQGKTFRHLRCYNLIGISHSFVLHFEKNNLFAIL